MSKDGIQRSSSSTFIYHHHLDAPQSPHELISVSSVSLLRRSFNRLFVRHPSPTCRSPQNPCPTVPLIVPHHYHPPDSRRSQFPETALARYTAICHTYRHRFRALLLLSQCTAPTCCRLESPHVHRHCASVCGQRAALILELA